MTRFFLENKIFFMSLALLAALIAGTTMLEKMHDTETTYQTKESPDALREQRDSGVSPAPSPAMTTATSAPTKTKTTVTPAPQPVPPSPVRAPLRFRWDDEERGDD